MRNTKIKEQEMNRSKTVIHVICGGLRFLCLILIPIFIASCADSGLKEDKEIKYEHSHAPRAITEDMTCPVCGMYPARYPTSQSEVIFKDWSFVAFDGWKDMFNFLLEMVKYDKNHSKDDVAAVYVKDFNSREWIDARDANFVIGSSAMGPMGKTLVPFSNHIEAMKFMEDHGGTMGHYSEITMDTIKSLAMGAMEMEGDQHNEKEHQH